MIVESPTKARKLASFLGGNYVVESSRGHIRDLPRGTADIPAKYKSEPWARLGVNVEADFEPLYVVSPDKKATVTELKDKLKSVDELYLATDGDREGEAIAWHLLEILKPKVPVRRMVFHEITEPAIIAAAENPRDLDIDLVDAQETRRILDRLYGYEVSPVLWKKVMPRLSAGRVQSVATRIIVQRERERMAFRSASYWDLSVTVAASPEFSAKLVELDGLRVASGRDFTPQGEPVNPDRVRIVGEAEARALADALVGARLEVAEVAEKPYSRRPYPPFMTSTLQQEASRKLRFSTDRTMRLAQRLYENGHITYMRTDSVTLSQQATEAARAQATALYGADAVPKSPRQYASKAKNAQEAHEAIRPAGDSFARPEQLAGTLDNDELRLYELIWRRTVASQMVDARGTSTSLRLTTAATAAGAAHDCVFAASGLVITTQGFLRAYVETVDELAGGEADDAQRHLPQLAKGQNVAAREAAPAEHATSPPARYTEASLVKALEDLGIGRPSTYAAIIDTIQERGYVYRKGAALVPAWVAFAVVGLMEAYFDPLVDYEFTAHMEDDLDAIAAGREHRTPWLTRFYYGDANGPARSVARAGGLKSLVGANAETIDAREVNSIPVFEDSEGRQIWVRVGKFGPYLERIVKDDHGELVSQRANLHQDLTPDELVPEVAEQMFATPSEGRALGFDPQSGHEIVVKEGRFGPYVTELLPPAIEAQQEEKAKAKKTAAPKPRTASLFKSMDPERVTLDDALRLLSLPRVVGVDPNTGEEITAQNGKFGPYLKRGTDSRSLANEDQLFNVTLEEALALYAEPKRRGAQAAAGPLRELGTDPVSGAQMVVKNGRFGPYVTDGTTNASLRKGDDVETLSDERASELLADRRAAGPAKKPARRAASKTAAATKKPSARKTTAKKPTS